MANYDSDIQQTRDRNAQKPLSEPGKITLTGSLVTPTIVDNTNKEQVNEDKSIGPLAPLYKNDYAPIAISYPRDIQSFSKGHEIQFNIRDIKPFEVNIEEVLSKFSSLDFKTALESIEEAAAAAKAKYQKTKAEYDSKGGGLNAVKTMIGDQMKQAGVTINSAASTLKFTPETYNDKLTTIRLYLPDTLSFNYEAQYDKLSLAEAINSTPIIGKISTAITSALNNNAAKLISNKLGYTFNPQQQMLFEGIDFREFDLQFTFTPVSPDEAQNVREIIRLFRRAAAPTKQNTVAGFFWVPPSIFDLGFFFNGKINPYVPPTLRCVLTAVNVDYAPNGWTALSDGSPVQTTLSLSFKEIELMDRTVIDNYEKQLGQ